MSHYNNVDTSNGNDPNHDIYQNNYAYYDVDNIHTVPAGDEHSANPTQHGHGVRNNQSDNASIDSGNGEDDDNSEDVDNVDNID